MVVSACYHDLQSDKSKATISPAARIVSTTNHCSPAYKLALFETPQVIYRHSVHTSIALMTVVVALVLSRHPESD